MVKCSKIHRGEFFRHTVIKMATAQAVCKLNALKGKSLIIFTTSDATNLFVHSSRKPPIFIYNKCPFWNLIMCIATNRKKLFSLVILLSISLTHTHRATHKIVARVKWEARTNREKEAEWVKTTRKLKIISKVKRNETKCLELIDDAHKMHLSDDRIPIYSSGLRTLSITLLTIFSVISPVVRFWSHYFPHWNG